MVAFITHQIQTSVHHVFAYKLVISLQEKHIVYVPLQYKL